jgi:hypothetical protein
MKQKDQKEGGGSAYNYKGVLEIGALFGGRSAGIVVKSKNPKVAEGIFLSFAVCNVCDVDTS